MGDRLLIFTRYPEVGRVKTRLIPALGETGATSLHQEMTAYTVSIARAFRVMHPITVTVCFTGAGQPQMEQWLGKDLDYELQVGEDLGQRMRNALGSALVQSGDRALIIGTDCPELDPAILADAFAQLAQHELVLGPATDGGYYLIGMGQVIPDLFTGIAWGTSQVLSSTMAIAERHSLSVALLPTLSDVDRPEDLPLWELARASITNLPDITFH